MQQPWVCRQSDSLRIEDIHDLFQGKISVLRVPEFCSTNVLDHALAKLREKEIVDYTNAAGVGKYKDIGMAYFEVEDPTSKNAYYHQVSASIRAVRDIFSPYLSPIDKVRLTLEDMWNHGASLLNLGEGSMFVGLIRATRKEILPHEDKLERDDPSIVSKTHYVGQAAFNCYLAVPPSGGALQLWDISLEDKVYHKLRGSSYGIDRSLLPPPGLTIQPKPGELVIFNPRKVHAVSEVGEAQTRISLSGFILYQGENKPMHFWS